MHKSDEELVSLLHQKGFKVTPQRFAIFRYLSNNESHPSADIIFADIKKDLPTISKGTVYKTLSMLSEIGVIHELNYGTGPTRYDINTALHINIICPNCGSITDHHSNNIETLWSQISNEIGGNIKRQRFEVYQECNECVVT
ncbi:MAG: transcriptional repressor [Candidatus Heimdallarchaeota archaeon]|nr:transcriptional repressor [Candidatus Heimdallarchaeota archaeon]